jgi:hypothetical protein
MVLLYAMRSMHLPDSSDNGSRLMVLRQRRGGDAGRTAGAGCSADRCVNLDILACADGSFVGGRSEYASLYHELNRRLKCELRRRAAQRSCPRMIKKSATARQAPI